MQYDGEVEKIEECAVCHGYSSVNDSAFSRALGLKEPFACRRCQQCGLRWLSPRPTADSYTLLYDNEKYFGGNQAVENYEHVVATRRSLYQNRLKNLKKVFPTKHFIKILDIGAATGDFVHEALQLGFDAVGLELSADARKKAKEKYSLDLHGGSLQDFNEGDKQFDVIHMHHVFEHLLNPNKCMEKCFRLLGQDGLLILEVPQQINNDLDRLKSMLSGGRKETAFTPYSLHHTYFFTPKTITVLLEKHDFSVIKLRTANSAYTPLWPFRIRNLLLFLFLQFVDKLYRGGNIIEIYARKKG